MCDLVASPSQLIAFIRRAAAIKARSESYTMAALCVLVIELGCAVQVFRSAKSTRGSRG